MKRRFSKEEDDVDDFTYNRRAQMAEDESAEIPTKAKKKKDGLKEEYKCGNQTCNKYYHSYTAFYNHCKKMHEGEFPEGSLVNGKIFEGPSKNRGRPRITKTETKNDKQIQAMKSQNELIEFLGTLNRGERSDELIVYVENPLDHVGKALGLVRSYCMRFPQPLLDDIDAYNRVICQYDLPQFYDPIETETAVGRVDSYSFSSIIKFLSDPINRLKCKIKQLDRETLKELTVIWLGRIVSVELLADIIWIFLQQRSQPGDLKHKEDSLIEGRTRDFLDKVTKFINCYGADKMPVSIPIPEPIKIES